MNNRTDLFLKHFVRIIFFVAGGLSGLMIVSYIQHKENISNIDNSAIEIQENEKIELSGAIYVGEQELLAAGAYNLSVSDQGCYIYIFENQESFKGATDEMYNNCFDYSYLTFDHPINGYSLREGMIIYTADTVIFEKVN